MVDLTRSARTSLTLQDQHVHGWPYKICTYIVDLITPARTWLALQDHHVHGWPYKIRTYMVGLTRPTRTWLALQDQHVHASWPYKIGTYMVDLTRSSARTWLALQCLYYFFTIFVKIYFDYSCIQRFFYFTFQKRDYNNIITDTNIWQQ